MNITELRQAPPETSQYLDAQLLAIGLAKAVNTPRGQRYVQELQVIDQQGQKETIGYWFDVDKPDFAMPSEQVNQWIRWKVKTKPKGQYLNISGYPEKQTQQPAPAPVPAQPALAPVSVPPQGQATPTQLNANTQAIIEQARGKQATAGEQIMDHMAGPTSPTDSSTKYPAPPIPALQAQQEYEAKERKKAVGMCMHGYIVAEINRRPITEVWDDKDAVQAAWKLANICVDGMGQVVDEETSF